MTAASGRGLCWDTTVALSSS
uniref:Uncharacterized protein n=1 Tax=Anguilla anguilla TaxID=7936 RepID=A0A0E9UB92_ANGAN